MCIFLFILIYLFTLDCMLIVCRLQSRLNKDIQSKSSVSRQYMHAQVSCNITTAAMHYNLTNRENNFYDTFTVCTYMRFLSGLLLMSSGCGMGWESNIVISGFHKHEYMHGLHSK